MFSTNESDTVLRSPDLRLNKPSLAGTSLRGRVAPTACVLLQRLTAKPLEDREGPLHGKVARGCVERLRAAWHHEAVLDTRENVNLDVLHLLRHGTIGIQHRRWRAVILVAPDDADRRRDTVELTDIVEHLRAVAGDAGVVPEPLRPENGERPAIAEAHRRRAAVALR